MVEPKFKVDICSSGCIVEPINEEAFTFEKEFFKRKMDVDASIPILKFILASPHTLTIDSKGYFIYDLDLSMKEEVLEELFMKRVVE